jgi:fatty-acyl-CoA synthase
VAVPSTTGRTLRYVSCGVALADHEVSIIDARGRRLPERVVGEIVVRGPSVSDGYFEAPRASAETFHSDGLHTGDRGYVANGQLYVTGRLKDTVIVNGRNYDPHTIEAVAEQIDAVRFAAAVNVAGAEGDELAMIVECSARSQNVAEVVRARIASALGVEPARVVCVAPGALPRTTSGKLRRTAAKTLVPRHE